MNQNTSPDLEKENRVRVKRKKVKKKKKAIAEAKQKRQELSLCVRSNSNFAIYILLAFSGQADEQDFRRTKVIQKGGTRRTVLKI